MDSGWTVTADLLVDTCMLYLRGLKADCLQTNSQAGPQPMEEFLSSSGRHAQPVLLRTPAHEGASALQAFQLDTTQVGAVISRAWPRQGE